MDAFVERQGFYDYINHFVAGAVMVIGIEILLIPFNYSLLAVLYQKLHRVYFSINSNGTTVSENIDMFLWNVCIVLLCFLSFYLLGVLVQELYNCFYNSSTAGVFNNKNTELRSGQNDMPQIFKILSRLVIKVGKVNYINHIFVDPNLITNPLKRKRYKQYAVEFAKRKCLFPNGRVKCNEALSAYFFAYCVYYIQVREKDKKIEKLRDIEGLAMSLSLIFLFLTLGSMFTLGVCFFYSAGWILFGIIELLVNAAFSILFDCYAERAIKNRIRMTLAVYEAERDKCLADKKKADG